MIQLTLFRHPLLHVTVFALCVTLLISGCADESFVYQRSVSELNQKAAELMQQGDYAGAVGRLESAHDLMPKEGSILFNLAIAYKENEQIDESIAAFEKFIKEHESHAKINDAVLSLAVVLEEKGDILVGKAMEAEEQKDEDAKKELVADSIKAYERAEKTYQLLLAHAKEGQVESLQNQIDAINETLEKLEAGKLDEITLF